MKKIVLIVVLFIGCVTYSQNKKYVTYRVSDNETITSIARKLGMTPYDLLKLNPDAKRGINIDEVLIIPNKNYQADHQKKVPKITHPLKSKDSIVNGVLYHTIKTGETIYSLANRYHTTKRKVRKLNNLDLFGSIKIGQVLKFPTDLDDCCTKTIFVPQKEQEPNGDFINYTVQPNDTYYSLSRTYGVSENDLKQLNPILNEGLKADINIKIPKAIQEEHQQEEHKNEDLNQQTDTLFVVEKPQYIIHQVKEKEGFFRLKQLYGVTEEELKAINPELADGLKLGMEIKVPNKVGENRFEEKDIHGKLLHVVMMLPLGANSDIDLSSNTNKSKLLNKVADFYLGSLMALDSIKKKGLSVNVKVFDTKRSDFVINKILNTYDFSHTDVVIAPIAFNQFKLISEKLDSINIPIISPISGKECKEYGITNYIQNVPSPRRLEQKMLDYISAHHTNQNIVIVTDEKSQDNHFDIDLIKSRLVLNDSVSISIIRMKEGYIKRTHFVENIHEDQENWVILASNNESTASITVENLAVFSEDVKITLFALAKPKNLNSKHAFKIKNKYLNRLKFQYPVANFIKNNNEDMLAFNEMYKIKYKTDPSDFSYKGFDTVYDALLRLSSYDKEAFRAGKSRRLVSSFYYKQNSIKSFVNLGMFIVKYNDYQLEEVE